jgi:HAE1 family hydrophobic/amphiphilic exporter-1
MFIIALLILGLTGLKRMPWDLNPKVDFPMVSVTIPYPGASPEEIEQRILRPLEDQVSVINGVDRVVSEAQENVGTVSLRFVYGIDVDVAASDVRDALDRTRRLFPDDVEAPSIFKLDIGAQPVVTMGIMGDRPPRDLRQMVEDEIKPVLGQVQGVAAVSVSGGEEREIRIEVDRERLDAAHLSIAGFARQLATQNIDVPSGNIKEGVRDYSVRVLGQFRNMDEIRQLRIDTPKGMLQVRDLATVQDTVAEPTTYARTNGQAAVGVAILKQSEANTVAVVDGVKRKLEQLVGSESKPGLLPADLKAVVSYDASERVREAIYDVRDALMWGALLAALVVFVFLHNVRGTIIVALAIPTCIISTFLPIGIGLHFTLNTMVMLGLALSVGILVDDSIVVLENINRHLSMGELPGTAAYNGRAEIGAATVATTLVDVVVYVPVALMQGIVGQFFFAFGITVFTCTLFSLFVAFSLTPMLAAWWYSRADTGVRLNTDIFARMFAAFDRGYKGLERAYLRLLKPAIRHPFITVGLGYGILILVLVGVGPRLGFEFFPRSDSGILAVDIETPVGTRIEETNRLTERIERELLTKSKYPEIKDISTVVGQGVGGFMGSGNQGGRYANLSLTLSGRKARLSEKQRSDLALAADLREYMAQIPGANIKVTTSGNMGPGGGDIEYNVLADNREALDQAAGQLISELKKIPGMFYVDLSSKPGRPEIHADIDRERAAMYNLSVAEIAAAVRTAFAGNTDSKFRESGDEYDLRIQFREFERSRVEDVRNLFVGLSEEDQPVRLKDVATITMSAGPSRIERYHRQRKVTVSAYLEPELASGKAQQLVEQAGQKVKVPGVSFAWTGDVQMMGESFGYMREAMLLAVILVYLVTAMLFNSLLAPFNVMLTLPMALVGAFVGLYLHGMSVSVVAIIGFIMLLGLVGKNAILVVDYTNTLRRRGMSRLEALETAGPHRMQPVLMTTLATIMGMMPTAIALNEGSEWRSPMAIAVIYGLALSTLLSLIVVPASYCIWDSIGNFFIRQARRVIARCRGNSCPPEDS